MSTAKIRIRSTGKYSANREPITRPMKIPRVKAPTVAAAAPASRPPRSRSKSTLHSVMMNSELTRTKRVPSAHQNRLGNGTLWASLTCSSTGTLNTGRLLRMRSKLTSNPTRVIHKPIRHPKNMATPTPTVMGASAPERAATALASVIEAGPASFWWSKRKALAPTMIEEPKKEAKKVPASVTGVPPGAV